jgi:hypothetical protein
VNPGSSPFSQFLTMPISWQPTLAAALSAAETSHKSILFAVHAPG